MWFTAWAQKTSFLECISCCEGTTDAAGLSFSSALQNGLLPTGGSIWAQEARDTRDQRSHCHSTAPGPRHQAKHPLGHKDQKTTAHSLKKKKVHTHTHTRCDCLWNCAQLWAPVIFKSFFDLSSTKVVKQCVYNNGWNKVITYELTAFSKIMNLTYSEWSYCSCLDAQWWLWQL